MNTPGSEGEPPRDPAEDLGKSLPHGAPHYRAYIGSPNLYDRLAASHFRLLTEFGLCEDHRVLDIGCGSLRLGKLLLVYLLPGRYYAIEPNRWLVDDAIRKEVSEGLIRLKAPTIVHVDDFSCSRFGVKFDFVFAHSIFSHASRDQISTCLREAAIAMHKDSVFLATYLESSQDSTASGWVYPECVGFTRATMEGLARAAGLCCIHVPYDTLISQTWVAFAKASRAEVLRILAAKASQSGEFAGKEAIWFLCPWSSQNGP